MQCASISVMRRALPSMHFQGANLRQGLTYRLQPDPLTGTFEVEVEVAPDGARFARGLVAKISLALSEGSQIDTQTVVPVTAIVEADGADATVYVLDADANVARRKQISVGRIVGDRVVVVAGLAVGEQVITDGAAWLADGKPVRLVGDAG
jgi:multidrug efflux pump subunit AcrA (membrane-fusion protein)